MTVVSVGPRAEKLNTVSNDHGRTHKCDFFFFGQILGKFGQKKIKAVSVS